MCVLCNAKLCTCWYQHVRSTIGRDDYMAKEHQSQKFNYAQHNESFENWLKKNKPWWSHPFPSQTDGIWYPIFATGLLCTIAVKMPLTDEWTDTRHQKILSAFQELIGKHHELTAAMTGAVDINVHDQDPGMRNAVQSTKWLFIKFHAPLQNMPLNHLHIGSQRSALHSRRRLAK